MLLYDNTVPRPVPRPGSRPVPRSVPRPGPRPVLRPGPRPVRRPSGPVPRPSPRPGPQPVPRSGPRLIPRPIHRPGPRPGRRPGPRPAHRSPVPVPRPGPRPGVICRDLKTYLNRCMAWSVLLHTFTFCLCTPHHTVSIEGWPISFRGVLLLVVHYDLCMVLLSLFLYL